MPNYYSLRLSAFAHRNPNCGTIINDINSKCGCVFVCMWILNTYIIYINLLFRFAHVWIYTWHICICVAVRMYAIVLTAIAKIYIWNVAKHTYASEIDWIEGAQWHLPYEIDCAPSFRMCISHSLAAHYVRWVCDSLSCFAQALLNYTHTHSRSLYSAICISEISYFFRC